jgi:predicted alpha/beta hydrolase
MLQRRRADAILMPFFVITMMLVVSLFGAPASAATPATTRFQVVHITASDGVLLDANVTAPTGAGPFPGIVLISSWGLNDTQYLAQASILARQGYVVLCYTARGFWGSGGQIETAGPADIADVSSAIDWMIANAAVDPHRVGAAGISYGAGISLLASAFDRRIRAVVAMSGWADLVSSFYGDQTRRVQAVGLLAASANTVGRPSAELQRVISAYFADRDEDWIRSWGLRRSASTYLDSINRNSPAIMLAHTYGDSVFGPNQVIDFFNRLTGPKRLELAPGDHAVVEEGGLIGLPSGVWTRTAAWFNQYLSGASPATPLPPGPPVTLRRLGSDLAEGYADWADVTPSTSRLGLGPVRPLDGTGVLGGTPETGWDRTIWAGLDTTAGAGVALLTNGFAALTGLPATVWLPSVNRLAAGVWISPVRPATTAIRGIARLRLTVTPANSRGTLVAYLYDTDDWGGGRLITHAPVSWLAATEALDVALPAVAYDVPAGHRLALVIDTADPLYLQANPTGAAIRFGGPSWLDLPIG